MTGASVGADAVTDRAILAGSAYRDEKDLVARQSLYQWQVPGYDLPGLVVDRLRDVRGTVADVGCGNGKFMKRLKEERSDLFVLGLDVSPGILDGLPRPVAVADAGQLPLRARRFDAVLALHMLYHVSDIPRAVEELARVVADDGIVIASTNSEHDKVELERLWEQAAADVLGVERGPSRISLSARFSLEKAPDYLDAAFTSVDVVKLPGVIAVPTPEPVMAHLASYRAWAAQHDVPFDATLRRAREIVERHIDHHGAFEINAFGGLLICAK